MPSRQQQQQLANHQHATNHRATFVFLVITVFSSILIVIGIVYLLYYLWFSLIHRSRTSPLDSSLPKLRRFTYKELSSATNGFSGDNFIGKGGSGTVYRGILRNGKLAAVKLLDSESPETDRDFQNELRILGGLESRFVVSLLGYCVDKTKRLVVYEYMPNRSLQESLFSERSVLDWKRRFEIILDVSRALEFLHRECDPPVIHGDVKPSNVLLDTEFRAKLSDFGLSRLKIEPDFGVDLFSQDLSGTLAGACTGTGAGESPAIGTPPIDGNEVDFSLALQASSSSTPVNSKVVCNRLKGLGLGFGNDSKGKELSTCTATATAARCGSRGGDGDGHGGDWINDKLTSYEDDFGLTVDNNNRESNLNLNLNHLNSSDYCEDEHKSGKKQWGKDWWWKQDGSGELCSKDYVREWIGSQISPPVNPDWDDDKNSEKPDLDRSSRSNKYKDSHDDNKPFEIEEKRHRKMQEWWKEEHLDELTKKKVEKKKIKRRRFFKLSILRRKRKPMDGDLENGLDPSKEFSFRKNSKNNEMWSGDVFSRELSSTTSMRGTLCYVAPEYGGCGFLIEKADIYSFGVLILVIVSGRRPLHVLASPMKLEKANLISWCRQLAHGGDLLELVDEKLKNEYDKKQASLCINLALACLQKMPELRPDIGDIVKVLKGEIELPILPFEFSPSPPSKLVGRSRSRRKNKNNVD